MPYYPPVPAAGGGAPGGLPIPDGGVVGHLMALGPEDSLMWVPPEAVRGTIDLPAGHYATAVLTDKPLAFWQDASGRDSAGNDRHLVPTNALTTTPSPITGLQIPTFEGVWSGLNFPHYRTDAAAWMNGPSITLEALLHKVTVSGSTERAIMARERSGGGGQCWRFGLTSAGALQIVFGTTQRAFPQTYTGPLLPDGVHHVAFTHDATTGATALYVDGEPVHQGVDPGAINGSTTAPLLIGASEGGGSGTVNLYFGLRSPLEGVAFHGQALSAERIKAHAVAAGLGV